DTGASLVMLPQWLTYELGIKIDPAKYLQTSTASSIIKVPQVVIPEIIWLEKSVKRVTAIVKDLPSETGVDGLLGLSFLKHFRLDIDFRKGILTLT
ncbi:MAG: retropepsin-like aspartic protease, partial [Patescibacteria group bacterium]